MRLVLNRDHYAEIVQRGLITAKASIWISAANIKVAHMEAPIGTRARGRFVSLFDWLKSKFDAIYRQTTRAAWHKAARTQPATRPK